MRSSKSERLRRPGGIRRLFFILGMKRANTATLQQQARALANVLKNVNEVLMAPELTDAQECSLPSTVMENIYPEGREEVAVSWRDPVRV
jgi:hypothetical protein